MADTAPLKTPEELILSTGEALDRKDPDALIAAYEEIDRKYQILVHARKQLSVAIAALTDDSEKRTRRVEGESRRAKVEMPNDAFDGSILFEAWNSFPKYRDRVLKIAQLRLKKREWAKLEGTKGPPSLNAFISMLRKASRGPAGTPRITVEK